MPCSGRDHPPRMAFPRGAFAGGRFLGFFWKRPVQVPSTARSATCIPYVSRSKRRLYRHPKPQRGVKDQTEPQAQARGQATGQLRTQKRRPGNTEHEKAIRQQKMRNNRSAMHHAAALGASSQLGAAPLLPVPAFPATPNPAPRKRPHPPASQQRAPRLPRSTPNPHATARLVAHFSRETAERKVTHITNEIVKPLILILLMETPEAPRREKSPKPCHIRTYSVIIPPKS